MKPAAANRPPYISMAMCAYMSLPGVWDVELQLVISTHEHAELRLWISSALLLDNSH